eukprot:g5587.t1
MIDSVKSQSLKRASVFLRGDTLTAGLRVGCRDHRSALSTNTNPSTVAQFDDSKLQQLDSTPCCFPNTTSFRVASASARMQKFSPPSPGIAPQVLFRSKSHARKIWTPESRIRCRSTSTGTRRPRARRPDRSPGLWLFEESGRHGPASAVLGRSALKVSAFALLRSHGLFSLTFLLNFCPFPCPFPCPVTDHKLKTAGEDGHVLPEPFLFVYVVGAFEILVGNFDHIFQRSA